MNEIELLKEEIEVQKEKKLDAHLSRCNGLLGRSALRKANNQEVSANSVLKEDGPFYCPVCLSDAVVRKCSEKVDHFAHHARQSPVIRKRDKDLHNRCRDRILEYLKSKLPNGNWAKERLIPGDKYKGFKDVIPDISGRINNVPIAIEVQASSYTIKRIFEKICEYQKRNTNPKIAVLYIIPLYEKLGEKPFRPRLFEKFLHSVYYGRVYYWSEEYGDLIQPVHFSPAKRWIEAHTWFDAELKEERTEGGFELTYRTIKIPNYSMKIDISKDFESKLQGGFEPKNVKKNIPQCTIFMDRLRTWWDKNEYKNIERQFDVFKELTIPYFIKDYNYSDDYDEELID